jgi:signal transduction histidine kinase
MGKLKRYIQTNKEQTGYVLLYLLLGLGVSILHLIFEILVYFQLNTDEGLVSYWALYPAPFLKLLMVTSIYLIIFFFLGKFRFQSKRAAFELRLQNEILKRTNTQLLQTLEQKERVDNIAESERSMVDSIMNSIGEGVFILGRNYKVLFLNNVARDLLQEELNATDAVDDLSSFYDVAADDADRAKEEAMQSDEESTYDEHPDYSTIQSYLKKDFLKLIKHFVDQELLENIKKYADETLITELHLPKKNKTLKMTISPIKGRNETYTGSVVLLHDITALTEVNSAKSNFISIVSHELRTPLTSIKGYISLLVKDKIKDEEKKKEAYGIIQSEANRLTKLITDLLDISKIESGKVEMKPKPTNLAKLTKSIIQRLQVIADKKKIELSMSIPRMIRYNLDPGMFDQILTNLITNGIKYTPEGGWVKVSAVNKKQSLYIFVEDSGVGISKENIPKLFNKFRQLEDHMTRKEGGSGLGLPIVKKLVEKHNGRILVRSSLGKGSRFIIILPKE